MAAASSVSNSVAGLGNTALSANNSVFAPFLHDESRSPFQYNGWAKVRNFAIDRLDVQPETAATFQGASEFRIPKTGDMLGPLQLMFNMEVADSGAGGAVGNYGLVGGAAYAAVQEVRMTYLSNLIQQFTGHDIFQLHSLLTEEEARVPLDQLTGFGLGATGLADTVAHAGAPGSVQRSYVLDLPVWWGWLGQMYLPYSMLAELLRIKVTWSSAQRVTSQDAASIAAGEAANLTTTLSAVKMRVAYIHLTAAERAELEARVNGSQNGITYKSLEWEVQEQTLTNDLQSTDIALRTFRHPTKFLSMVVRPASGPAGTGGVLGSGPNINDTEPYLYHDIDRYTVIANGSPIHPETDHNYAIHYLKPLYFSAKSRTQSIYTACWDANPEDFINSNGHRDFGNLHNPQMRIASDAGLLTNVRAGQSLVVTIWAWHHQAFSVQGGEITRVFN